MLKPSSFRRGLTLIELVVVMLILAAVAGIVLPLLPNMVTKAHTTTSATNIAEVGKAIQTYEATYLSFPNNFDSLVTGSGSLATYVPGYTGADLTTVAISDPATDPNVEALANAGITSVALMAASGSGDFSPTFYPYGNTITAITPTTSIAALTALPSITTTAASREFGIPLGSGTFVVFGLGGRTTMQGKTLQEAPVHFDDSPDGAPNRSYARLGVVFQTAALNTSGTLASLDKARFTGVVGFHDDRIASLNDHLAEYWAANRQ